MNSDNGIDAARAALGKYVVTESETVLLKELQCEVSGV
jgi:hypothetical protein